MTRERQFRTEAIVLKRSDLGEADRVLSVYTPDYGMVRTLARGIRRPTSRKAGHLELFVRSRVLMNRREDLCEITQAESVEAFRPLRDDLRRTACAFYVAELLLGFARDSAEAQPLLYDLLLDTLRRLSSERDLWIATRYFELHMLTLTGFRPELHICVACHEPLPASGAFFSPAQGGIVCPRCGEGRVEVLPLSAQGAEVMRYLQTRPYESCAQLPVTGKSRSEIERALRGYDLYILERELKSVAFLNDLRRRWAEFERAARERGESTKESSE